MKAMTRTPDLTLPDQNGNTVSLKDFAGKWAVVYFYPKDDTPGCTIEAKEFTELLPAFTEHGAAVLGISPDSANSHCNFIGKYGLAITLLSDPEKKTIKAFGAWGTKKRFGKESEGVIRSTFLIGPDGAIARAWEEVKAQGHAAEVLEELKRRV